MNYSYSPLPDKRSSIRLVELLPNSKNDNVIRCRMLLCHLDQAGQSDLDARSLSSIQRKSFRNSSIAYTAVSYEWGPPGNDRLIEIDYANFRVRKNLYEFLQVLTSQRKDVIDVSGLRLWIDAICINQEDLDEKAVQVHMMANIYASAQTTFVWLGLNPEIDTPTLFRTLSQVDANDAIPSVVNIALQLCKLRYWTRRWIIQELVCSSSARLFCNSDEMDYDLFSEVLNKSSITDNFSRNDLFFYVLSNIVRLHSFRRTHPDRLFPISSLVSQFEGSECMLVQDRIYAFRSISDNGESIPVDYRCSAAQLLYRVLSSPPEEMAMYASLVGRSARELGIRYDHDEPCMDSILDLELPTVKLPRIVLIGPSWQQINDLWQYLRDFVDSSEELGDLDLCQVCQTGTCLELAAKKDSESRQTETICIPDDELPEHDDGNFDPYRCTLPSMRCSMYDTKVAEIDKHPCQPSDNFTQSSTRASEPFLSFTSDKELYVVHNGASAGDLLFKTSFESGFVLGPKDDSIGGQGCYRGAFDVLGPLHPDRMLVHRYEQLNMAYKFGMLQSFDDQNTQAIIGEFGDFVERFETFSSTYVSGQKSIGSSAGMVATSESLTRIQLSLRDVLRHVDHMDPARSFLKNSSTD